LKLPADVRQLVRRRFDSRHRDWLESRSDDTCWPWEIPLGIPGEQSAVAQLDAVRAWVRAWQGWTGTGTLDWTERRWRTLGTQRLPERLRFDDPQQIASWLGETGRWDRACCRHALLVQRWPVLGGRLGKFFNVLADYPDADFGRLMAALDWLAQHPGSGLYLRQLPIPGLDTKWIEMRKAILSELLCHITGHGSDAGDFYSICGLRRPPFQLRMRLLDPALRARVGGIGDLSVSADELAQLDIRPAHVLIVENLQTGLALADLPGTATFMGLGYGVDALARLPWVRDCIYWGDMDTHGFAILNRARACLPSVRSILMDEQTLLSHRPLWSHEDSQHSALELPLLTGDEAAVYKSLKHNAWGQNVRLEQERLSWSVAWTVLLRAFSRPVDNLQ
jgi:hypothetical protein